MKVSVCIPAHRRPHMLYQAILSILTQDADAEIVIRDDDPDFPVVENDEVRKVFQFCGERLVYLKDTPHLGNFSGVANAVLAHAAGDILYLMGSDDLLAPGALYSVREVFEQDRCGGPLWLYGKTVSVDSNLRRIGIDGEPTTYEELLQKNRIGCPSVFWNRNMMNLIGRLDPRYAWAADYDLWLRMWEVIPPIFLDQELGVFRHHEQHMSTDRAQEIEKEVARISQRHRYCRDAILRGRMRQIMGQNPRSSDEGN